MKITKYEHACVALEEQGKRLIIDPGEFSTDFGGTNTVAAVVVTHVHADHFYPEHLDAIVKANPGIPIFTTSEVAAEWKTGQVTVVHAGDEEKAGPFTLCFYGDMHAEIHRDFPRNQNTGVLVNELFYYPGDSFTVPDKPVSVLAVPASAPWMKAGEAMDFMTALKPSIRSFRTHDAHLSVRGLGSVDAWLGLAAKPINLNYAPLQIGESFEI
jgi:L-ascorbate metabolism protein UlaG (beta-lactamase superfamily)